MKKFFKKYRKIIGVFLLLITVAFFIFWEVTGRKELLYTDVATLNTDVKTGQLITGDMIDMVKRETDTLITGAIVNPYLIVGKEAVQFIPKNSMLREEFFDNAEIVLNENEYVFKFPEDWVASYPDTLRRKDKIFFYPIQNGRIVKEPIAETYIAYVKDGSNREVENINNDRLVGTSSIKTIEIIANDKLLEVLTQYINQGYKFTILYN